MAKDPTTCYVAYCNDRHIDPEIAVFMDLDSAIIWASEWMRKCVAHPENLREEKVEGFLYWLSYSEESDHAFVKETKLQEDSSSLKECWSRIEEAKEGQRRAVFGVVDSATKILAAVPDSVLELAPPEAIKEVTRRLEAELQRWAALPVSGG